jgi:uncharacterized protein (DUF2345 family)
MPTDYDVITNDTDKIQYINNPQYSDMYPDPSMVNIFGPVQLPRVYGKNLTAFEIASSGKIAITINDIHSLDVSNSAFGGVNNSNVLTTFQTKSNYALEMMTNNRDIRMVMDSYSNDMTMFAKSNIYMTTASNDLVMTIGKNTALKTKSNVDMTADNGSMRMYANNSNMYITMSHTASNMTVYSSSNITVQADKDMSLTASNNYTLNVSQAITQTAQNGSFVMRANSNNMYITMSNTNNVMKAYAASNIVLVADKNVDLTAGNDYSLRASSNINVSAQNGSMNLFVHNSNMYMTMDNTTDRVSLYTNSNLSVTACNNLTMIAKSNVVLAGTTGSMDIIADASNMRFFYDNTTTSTAFYTKSNLSVTASNNMSTIAQSNITFTAYQGNFGVNANNSNMVFVMNNNGDKMDIYTRGSQTCTTSNDHVMNATSNVTITAFNGDLKLYANSNNMLGLMENSNNTIFFYSQNNFGINTSNDFYTKTRSNVTFDAINGGFRVAAHSSNMYLSMDDVTDTTTLYTKTDLKATASNSIQFAAKSNVDVVSDFGYMNMFANKSNVSIRMNNANDSNLSVYAVKNINLTASNSFSLNTQSNIVVNSLFGETLFYGESNMFVHAHQSNMYIKMAAPSDTVTIYGLSNVYLNTSNDLFLNSRGKTEFSSSNVNMYLKDTFYVSACNDITLSTKDKILVTGDSVDITANSDMSYSAQSNFNIFVKSSPYGSTNPVLAVTTNDVQIRGDLVITGSINTSNIISTAVQENILKVNDKVIYLASQGSNDAADPLPYDGAATNDGAGIVVDGIPSGVTSSNDFDMYRKFFKWNIGTQGTLALGTSNLDQESFWDLQGGSFRITQKKKVSGTIRDTSFGFRINEADELELIKKYWSATSSAYVYKRIAKFGRT